MQHQSGLPLTSVRHHRSVRQVYRTVGLGLGLVGCIRLLSILCPHHSVYWGTWNRLDSVIVVMNLSSRFLNSFVVLESTTSCGSLFHTDTTLFEKNLVLTLVLALLTFNFSWWPLVELSWFLSKKKNWLANTLTCPVTSLKVSIRSLRLILSSTLVKSNIFKRSVYVLFPSPWTSFVALLCTFSMALKSWWIYMVLWLECSAQDEVLCTQNKVSWNLTQWNYQMPSSIVWEHTLPCLLLLNNVVSVSVYWTHVHLDPFLHVFLQVFLFLHLMSSYSTGLWSCGLQCQKSGFVI